MLFFPGTFILASDQPFWLSANSSTGASLTTVQQSTPAAAMSAGALGTSCAAVGTARSTQPAATTCRTELRKTAIDLLARHQQLLDRIDADLEIGLGAVVELDLDDALNALFADDDGHADIEVIDA